MVDHNGLRARLNGETARLAWPELERHFARGAVVTVAADEDLVEVAASFAEDDSARVAAWMEAGKVARTSEAEAARWSDQGAELWAVVVAPWVLVQEPARE